MKRPTPPRKGARFVWPLFRWKQCEDCGRMFRRETGWKATENRSGGSKIGGRCWVYEQDVYWCNDCHPVSYSTMSEARDNWRHKMKEQSAK